MLGVGWEIKQVESQDRATVCQVCNHWHHCCDPVNHDGPLWSTRCTNMALFSVPIHDIATYIGVYE